MKHIRNGIALACVLALVLQLFTALPAASAETVQAYRLVDRVEAGKTYVIVADDTYALNNKGVSYNNQDTLGATAVAITNGVITSEVTEDMLWTVKAAAGVDASIDGRDQYFIYDQAGQQLNRRSGSTGTAPLSVSAYDASKPQYSTWSFADRGAGSAWTMYVNSYRDSDYYFTLTGASGGFNAPGKAQSGYDFRANGSAIVLYDVTDRLDEIEKPGGDEPETPVVDPASVSYDAIFLSDLHNGVGGYNGLKQMMAELKAEGVNPRVLSHGGDYVEDGKGGTVEWESQVYGVIHGTEADTYPADAGKFEIVNKDTAEIVEGEGLTLSPTADAFEPVSAGFGGEGTESAPKDLVKVPVSGDWTATLKLDYDLNNVQWAMNSYFSILAMEGEDYQNMAGIRGTNNVFQDYLRKGGTVAEPTVAAPGWQDTATSGFTANGTYWLRLDKEGTTYAGSWSADGESFTELFRLEDTGIDAEYIVLDAYKTSSWSFGGDANWLFTLKSLEFEGGSAPGGGWVLADSIEAGRAYVIVADGQYAMTSAEIAGKASYAGYSTTRGAKAVEIEGDALTGEVTDDMIWTFEAAAADPAYDGEAQYFLTDASGKYLRRGSMSQRNAALVLDDGLTATMRYYTWSFKAYDGLDATYAMYANSERAYGSDYPGRVAGDAAGFDIPGTLEHRDPDSPFAFMNDGVCSKITLYVQSGAAPCEHDYKAVVTAPTCTEKGYTTYTCAKCGKSYKGDEVAALGHDYKAVVTAPTCTAKGFTTYTCARCGESYTGSETAALGHDWGEGVVTKEPTETAEGVRTYTCARCGEQRTEAIPVLAHEHSYTAAVTAPTCTEAGYTTYTCACGDSYVADEVPALGHSFGEWAVSKAATCTDAGEEARTCANCGEKETRAIAALGHDFVDGVCTRCGEKDPDYVPPIDRAALQAAIAAAEKLDPEKYTDETADALSKALAAAEAALEADTQAAVDKAAADLDAAVKALVEKPIEPPFRFDDVKDESQYYFDPVYWAVDNEITTGTSPTTFSPNNGYTRAQVVTFLWRAAGKPEPTKTENPFNDVKPDAYYYKAVLWAVEKGITTGTSATTFRPDQTCTRGQIVTFLWRNSEQPEPTKTENPFTDVPSTQYYYKAVLWAVEKGITKGTSADKFSPDSTCTRAQIVTFLYRAQD